jgi:hypothetical protein
VDYRIIMLTDHGAGFLEICVAPPLSSTSDCTGPPGEVANQFYHYDVDVQSWNSVCVFFASLAGGTPDEWSMHPSGSLPLLRPDALKVFIEATDDQMGCTWNSNSMVDGGTIAGGQTAALEFDQTLLAQSPTHFGTVVNRRYVLYNLLGVAPKNPSDYTVPYEPSNAVVSLTCPTGVSAGTGYQWLAKGTGGLSFSGCDTAAYGGIFDAIAQDVIAKTNGCTLSIPPPPMNQSVDQGTLLVEYFPTNGPPQMFTQVSSLPSCVGDQFYVEGGLIKLCPAACSSVAQDPDASIVVHYSCM